MRVIVGDTLLTYDIILLREVSDSIQNPNWKAKTERVKENPYSSIRPFILTQAENPNSKD